MSDSESKSQTETKSYSSSALETVSFDDTGILYAGESRGSGLFVDYFRTLVRHRGLILALAIAGVIASFLWNFTTFPVYRARTSLDIQSLNSDFMNMKSVAPTGQGNDASQGDNLQTQIKLLQSDTLLERTVSHLRSEPHPQYIDQKDLASRVEHGLLLTRGKHVPYDNVIDDAAKHVTVKPIGITRLVEITCDSWDPEISAKFCNTLVEQFKEGDLETRQAESENTSNWLTSQVKDVKLKAEESERKLEAATGGDGLVLSQQSTSVGEDRLRDMQSEYVRAQADRMQKEALAGIGSASIPGMDPSLKESPAYHQYEQKLSELQGEVAKLVPPLTEANPQVIHLRSQIRATEADMASERAANGARLKADYQAALHREAMLAGAYHRQEGEVSAELGKASRVSLLRREVESEQQLYQNLLQLAREAGFASAIHASTVRVVDAAKAMPVPFSPRRGSSAASGLLAGTFCGIGLAFFIDRTGTVFRVPGETERYLGLCELGVIPSAPRPRSFAPISMNGLGGAEIIPARTNQGSLASWSENFSIVAEAYRNTTTSIMLSENPRDKGRVYILSSANAGEGKTTVTSNLGVALSKSRLRVLLIDGDLRKPALHKVLQIPNEFGLRNLLRGETAPASDPLAKVYQATAIPNLFVLPSGEGTEEVVELLHSPHAKDLIKGLRSEFDVIIIDTPPMLHLADTRVLASHAQGAILVVRAGSTSRDEAMKARDVFVQDRVRMVGTILNDFNPQKNGLSDYYKSYYRYVEEVSVTNSASSWLGGLLSSADRWMMQPKSDSGVISTPSRIDLKDASLGALENSAPNATVDPIHGPARRSNGAVQPTYDAAQPTYDAAQPASDDAQPLYSTVEPERGPAPPMYGASPANGGAQPGFDAVEPSLTGAFAEHPAADTLEDFVSHLVTKIFRRSPAQDDMPPIETFGKGNLAMASPAIVERRRSARQEGPQLFAHYWDGGPPQAHDIRDISVTGLYVLAQERWYPGTQVMIVLQRPGATEGDDARSIKVRARVVRYGSDGLGFEFVMPEKPAGRGRAAQLAAIRADNGDPGAGLSELQRFLQRLPGSGA